MVFKYIVFSKENKYIDTFCNSRITCVSNFNQSVIGMIWMNMLTNSLSLKHKNTFCVNYLLHDILIIIK
jgi:hypothetical protein